MSDFFKYTLGWIALFLIASTGLKYYFNIPIVQTLLLSLSGFFGLPAIGLLVTLDDDLPGGFNDPHREEPFPWKVIGVLVLFALLAVLCFYLSQKLFKPF